MSEALRLAGREVGRYRVVSLLGTGGMGAVYDAVDATLGRHVALKILPPSVVTDPDRLRRFAQEARAASALNHPHVITVYDIGTFTVDEREIHFISMEKIEGATQLGKCELCGEFVVDLNDRDQAATGCCEGCWETGDWEPDGDPADEGETG